MTNSSTEKNPFTNEDASCAYEAVDPIYEMSAKYVLDFVNPTSFPKNAQILDIGAGTGVASEMIIKTGFGELTLLEPSQAMLAQAQKRLGEKAGYIEASIENLNLDDIGTFDLIYALNCFHLFQDMSKALANIACLLKPSAVFVFNISAPTYSFDLMTNEERFIIESNLNFYDKLYELTPNPIIKHTTELLQKILDGNADITFTKSKTELVFQSVGLNLEDYREVIIKINNQYQKNIWRMMGTAFSQDQNSIEEIIDSISLPQEVEIRQAIFKFSNSN